MKRLQTLILLSVFVLCGGVFAADSSEDSSEASSNWSHSSLLGIVLGGGNTDAQTYNAKQETSYKFSENTLKTTGHFLYGKSAGAKIAENWHLDLRYERDISDRFAIYAGPGVEGDTFSGFKERYNLGTGGKYWIIPGDRKASYFFGELGYQFSHQKNVAGVSPATIDSHFIRSYLEASKAFENAITAKLWVELLPDLADSKNVLFNFEPSLSVALSNHFALKLAFTGRYDGLPNPGKKKFDWLYSTSLVANY